MATVRIKRRRTGNVGPPSSLLNAELAFNEVGQVLYIGTGITTNSAATSIIPIGGSGAFVNLSGNQTISGVKEFAAAVYFNNAVFAATPDQTDNSTALATTAFVKNQNYVALVNGFIPAAVLPSFVDDVLEYSSFSNLPETGETGKIYVVTDTGASYRWSGTGYVEIIASPGTTDAITEGSLNLFFTTDRAAAAAPVQSVAGRTGVIVFTKSDVGLSAVDNTADLNKPISVATQTAIDAKADAIHGHTISDISNLTTTITTLSQTLEQKVNTTDIIDGGTF
jgi:hypothetical protein